MIVKRDYCIIFFSMIKVEYNPKYKDNAASLQCGRAFYGLLRNDEGLRREIEEEIVERVKLNRSWGVCVLHPIRDSYRGYLRIVRGRYMMTRNVQNSTRFATYQEASEVAMRIVAGGLFRDVGILEWLHEEIDEGELKLTVIEPEGEDGT